MTATSTRPSNQRVQPLRKPKKQLPFPLNLYQTAVGKKWVMALTGLGLIGFVLFHMAGNFKVFVSPKSVNLYGESLRDLGGHLVPRTHLLWVLRFGLLGMFGLHIHSAISLAQMGRASNPKSSVGGDKKYAGGQEFIAANFASRTMRWTGPIILLYVIFHLADLTWGVAGGYDYRRGDVYHNLSESLSFFPVALIYIVASIALAVHLFHGVWSMFQSLGINSPKYNTLRKGLAAGIAGVLLVGNLSLPVAALTGIIDTEKAECYEGIHDLEGRCDGVPVPHEDGDHDEDGATAGEADEIDAEAGDASGEADGTEEADNADDAEQATSELTTGGTATINRGDEAITGTVTESGDGEQFIVTDEGTWYDLEGNSLDGDGNRYNAAGELVQTADNATDLIPEETDQ